MQNNEKNSCGSKNSCGGKNGCCQKEGEGACKTKCCPITGIPFKCFGKVFIYAIVAGLIAFGVNYIVWGNIFRDAVMAPEFAHLWRPMDASQWKLMPVGDLVFGLCLAVAYVALLPALSWCKAPSICRGMKFGIIISLIPAISNTYMWYITAPINQSIVMASFLASFLSCMLGAGVIGMLDGCCKKKCAEKAEGASCSTGLSGNGDKNHCGGKNGCGSKE